MSQISDPQRKRILVADDEPLYLRTTGELLRKAGYDCECVADADAARAAMQQSKFDLVLSDLNMPGNFKLELLHHGRAGWPDVPLIVITGVPSLPTAIESLRLGIADYLIKPVRYEDLLFSVRRALTSRSTPAAVQSPDSHYTSQRRQFSFAEIIGESPPMRELYGILDRVSHIDSNVLITGESGTGKEVVARTIHQHSPRSKHPFRIIDCTAIPESLFESVLFGHAKGAFTGAVKDQRGLLSGSHLGTAFFDEIGELPLLLQSKLLRTVQEQTFTPVGQTFEESLDTRFVCATNRDLAMEVQSSRFRRDLFYRLAVIHIHLPPLRERGDDVILLADHFRQKLQPAEVRVVGFSDDVVSCFRRYSWPGNVRELRNVVERSLAFAQSTLIELHNIPPAMQHSTADSPLQTDAHSAGSRDEAIDEAESRYLKSLLKTHEGNVSKAAAQAGVSRQGMHKMLARHGINAAEYRR